MDISIISILEIQWKPLGKKKKGVQIKKEEVIPVLNDKFLYKGKQKYSSKRIFVFIREFDEVSGYKINTEKSIAFALTNSEQQRKNW